MVGQFNYKATAIVLAGGKSERFGEDKSLLPVYDKTLIEHILSQLSNDFSQILIGADNIEKYSFLEYQIVSDRDKEYGPLMGMLSCLEHSENDLNFITACDIPNINKQLLEQMFNKIGENDVIVPILKNGFVEPLFAVYRKSVINYIEEILYSTCERKIRTLFNRVRTKYIRLDYDIKEWYTNINTRNDYYKFIAEY